MTSPYVNHEYRQQQLDHDLVQCSAHVSWETGRVVWPISITWTHASSLRPKPPPSRWTSLTDGRPSSVTSATCASMYYLLPKEWMRPASFKDMHIIYWHKIIFLHTSEDCAELVINRLCSDCFHLSHWCPIKCNTPLKLYNFKFIIFILILYVYCTPQSKRIWGYGEISYCTWPSCPWHVALWCGNSIDLRPEFAMPH